MTSTRPRRYFEIHGVCGESIANAEVRTAAERHAAMNRWLKLGLKIVGGRQGDDSPCDSINANVAESSQRSGM